MRSLAVVRAGSELWGEGTERKLQQSASSVSPWQLLSNVHKDYFYPLETEKCFFCFAGSIFRGNHARIIHSDQRLFVRELSGYWGIEFSKLIYSCKNI